MSRLNTMVLNHNQIDRDYRPSEIIMYSLGWEYTKEHPNLSPFRQWRRYMREKGLRALSLGQAFKVLRNIERTVRCLE